MRDPVIYEVTKGDLETGMRGIPAGYCVTSSVDPIKGLAYVGRPISELGSSDPIEVIYLLYYGEAGSKEQVKIFEQNLQVRAKCKPETIQHIEALPHAGHPMDVLSAALLIAGMYEGTEDYREDCLNVIAKIPQIAAVVINRCAGWGPTPPSNPELGYMENFIHMLQFPGERKPELTQVMRLFDLTHFDHDGGNLSAFVGKAVASGLEHMWGSLAAAMTALAGPRHGRANQDCLEFVREVLDTVGSQAKASDIEQFVRAKLNNKEVIPGFGHAVLRVEDPRATIFYNLAQTYFANDPLIKIAMLLRTEGSKVLKENPKISNPYPNIDAITGSVFTAAGFPYPDYYTILFGLSRCVGIAIQIVYERMEARAGKGTPIVRPLYLYKSRK
jgi:citrate synthase